MGWNVQGSYDASRSRSKETGTQTSDTTNQFRTNATFRPEGQATLDALGGYYAGAAGNANQANRFYQQNLNNGGVNPYAQQVVDAQSKVANQDFSNRLAQVRSGGFRGGAGRDTINQGMFVSDFTNQQNAQNVKTLLDAFTQAQNERFASAGALSQNQNAAQSFLALLRGEEGDSRTQSKTDFTKYMKSQNEAAGISGGYGAGMGGG